MKDKEMTLSDKIEWCPRCSINEGNIKAEDVKKFIADLKEEMCAYEICNKKYGKCDDCKIIDKLAGSELINHNLKVINSPIETPMKDEMGTHSLEDKPEDTLPHLKSEQVSSGTHSSDNLNYENLCLQPLGCECGHKAKHHLIDLDTDNLYRDCEAPDCKCKKFKPKKEVEE